MNSLADSARPEQDEFHRVNLFHFQDSLPHFPAQHKRGLLPEPAEDCGDPQQANFTKESTEIEQARDHSHQAASAPRDDGEYHDYPRDKLDGRAHTPSSIISGDQKDTQKIGMTIAARNQTHDQRQQNFQEATDSADPSAQIDPLTFNYSNLADTQAFDQPSAVDAQVYDRYRPSEETFDVETEPAGSNAQRNSMSANAFEPTTPDVIDIPPLAYGVDNRLSKHHVEESFSSAKWLADPLARIDERNLHLPSPMDMRESEPEQETGVEAQIHYGGKVLSPSSHPVSNDISDQIDSEEPELSPVEYARAQDLCRDHLKHDPFAYLDLLGRKNDEDGLTEDSHLPQFHLSADVNVDERLTLPQEAAKLLAYAKRGESDWIHDDVVLSLLPGKNSKSLRVELPLLLTDPELDMADFATKDGFDVKLHDVRFPLEIVDNESNGGVDFPRSYMALEAEAIKTIESERLEVTREALTCIQNALKDEFTEDDRARIWQYAHTYKRNKALEPITPPLSPMLLPEPIFFEPASSDCQVPILSDPESPTKTELEALEREIFNQDVPAQARDLMRLDHLQPQSEHVKLGDIYSPLASIVGTMSSSIEAQTKVEDLKVEETLTPSQPTPPSKTVHFSDIIEEMMLESSELSDIDLLQDKFFEEAFGSAAEEVKQRAEQEKLSEADARARVELPMMDFSLPSPPWQVENNDSALAIHKKLVQEKSARIPPTWPGAKKLHLKLQWTPFSSDFAQLVVKGEDITDEIVSWDVLEPPDERVVTSADLTWKPEGLRILDDEDDDDDDIELGSFQTLAPQDLSSLIKKRKLELEELEDDRATSQSMFEVMNVPKGPTGRKSQTATGSNRSVVPQRPQEDLIGGMSLLDSLENFLEMRGAKKPKLANSASCATTRPTKASAPNEMAAEAPVSTEAPPAASEHHPATSLPSPMLNIPHTEIKIVVSSTLLRQRSLFKLLEQTLPTLTLIQRDFTRHNASAWLPNSITRSPITSPLDSEADFCISPSTGIILTSLQMIKQQPLPGQKAKSAIRERVEGVSVRYERLVVLVGEASLYETTLGLDEHSALAFSEFVGFTAGLPSTVLVRFVAGGEETLVKWLASDILRYCVPAEKHVDVIEEESHWELFLRRAGMNVPAAHMILSALKAPEGVNTDSPTKVGQYGLTAFVEMGRARRRELWGSVVGKSVIDRVSDVVDQKWRD